MIAPDYIKPLEKLFAEHTDAEASVQMKKYMKDRYDYFGLKAPLRKELCARHKQNYGLIPEDNKEEIVTWCWEAPQREFQYFAMDFLGKTAKKADENIISLYEYMITTKSWWDTVDFIASNLVGVYLKKFPEKIDSLTSKWMDSGNMWLQRTCLLFQLKYRQTTDIELLTGFIFPLMESKEFFIRKAIGWSLREYSKTNPGFVLKFVEDYPLSGLSEREALKWIKAKNKE